MPGSWKTWYVWSARHDPCMYTLLTCFRRLQQSLLHFIKMEPWGDFSFFKSFVTEPFHARDPKALDVVAIVLEQVLLRREKSEFCIQTSSRVRPKDAEWRCRHERQGWQPARATASSLRCGAQA